MVSASEEKVSIEEKDLLFRGGSKNKELLGKGNFAIVYQSSLSDGRKVAIKRIQLHDVSSDKDHVEANREVFAMGKLNHSNVLKLYSVREDDHFKYLILELCEGTLNDYFNGLDPNWNGKKYMGPVPADPDALYQLADGLHCIHDQMLVHRNINARNILISSPSSANQPVSLKIADFGFSKPTNDRGSFSIGNKSNGSKINHVTAAPELLQEGRERADQMSDIFSMGCMFFTYLTKGKHVFLEDGDTNPYAIPINILNGNYWLKGRLSLNQEFAEGIIQEMIKHDAKDRTKMGVLKQKLAQQVESISKNITVVTFTKGDVILGKGSFGIVYEKLNNEGKKVAVKRVRIIETYTQSTSNDRESTINKVLDHPNVLKIYSAVSDLKYLYLTFEWCDGTLREYCNANYHYWTLEKDDKKYEGRVPSDKEALYQMASGLHHIHTNQFVHREIKPSNILIYSGNTDKILLKISDFVGAGFDITTSDTAVGYKSHYLAPELLNKQQNLSEINNTSPVADIFSLGCVFFTFLTKGNHLFKKVKDTVPDRFAIPCNIVAGSYESLEGRLDPTQYLSFQAIIRGMVQIDPNQRMKIDETFFSYVKNV